MVPAEGTSAWRLFARGGLWFSLLVLTGAPAPLWAEMGAADTVRRDWYFRESLLAIRDWETILAAWEKVTPKDRQTSVFGVPADGKGVAWVNPIPRPLWPDEAGIERVVVRLAGGRVQVERSGRDGKVERSEVEPGQTVVGCRHPGGGGKDQWYHAYRRRFDAMTAFMPRPAPFGLEIASPADLQRGENELSVLVRNAGAKNLEVALKLELLTPGRDQAVEIGSSTLTLAPAEGGNVRFPVALSEPGGGMLRLSVQAEGQSYWLPLLTHVEHVEAVLKGVEQVLSDAPDAAASAELADLRRQAAAWDARRPSPRRPHWRGLFEAANALRDRLLLRRIRFDTLLFIKRQPFFSEQPYMDAHHLYNRPGGGIYRLSSVRPDGRVTSVADNLGEGIYRDLCLHWDAKRLLMSFGNGSDNWDGSQSYHVYELGVDGRDLRQLTFGPKNDCEPFYLPGGGIGFTSDRGEHFVMCGGDRHAANLFVMNADGSLIRRLSFNIFNDFNPSMLPDGRIIYDRWEYNERSVTSLHKAFTIHPDGTHVAPYYGSATIRPNVIMFPRGVPGSSKVMALLTAHHGQTHGPVALIDSDRGVDGDAPLSVLTPGVPVSGEKVGDSFAGWFSDPWPLSETTFLCSYAPVALPWLGNAWALYVCDRHGNLALVHRDRAISCAEPVPLETRPRPHVLSDIAAEGAKAASAADKALPGMRTAGPRSAGLPPAGRARNEDAPAPEALLLLIDVYEGLGPVRRGQAKFLRILEDVPRKGVHAGGVIRTAATGTYTVKRVLGTVGVEEDGSACFVVPADRNVYFEVLDAEEREIQRMRSVVCLKSGEQRTCIGCHEPRTTAPPNRRAAAFARRPSRPDPPPWGSLATVSFLRDVQPLLNDKCISCHAYDRSANRVILTDDLTDQFNVAYEELVGYLSAANAMRWDHPDDVYARPPWTYGSKVSPLAKLLDGGHHGVRLTAEDSRRLSTWIDTNGIYYDRYETGQYPNRRIFAGQAGKAMLEVYSRRCRSCHAQDTDARRGTWWLSINRRDATSSRALQAPLARSSGGWQRCGAGVFADANDADYKALREALASLGKALAERPREDLLSLRGTTAEGRQVTMPPPPPPTTQPAPPEGDWVYLSDLKWESARAGWSPNNDALPRRDRDIENKPLRLGARAYPKGIGTHAPSEVVYRLQGGCARFVAAIGGAEAGGSVVFQVYGDDKLLYDSGVLRGLREVKKLDVGVEGVRVLRLVVTDAGDGHYCDEANWADARLLKTPRKNPPSK